LPSISKAMRQFYFSNIQARYVWSWTTSLGWRPDGLSRRWIHDYTPFFRFNTASAMEGRGFTVHRVYERGATRRFFIMHCFGVLGVYRKGNDHGFLYVRVGVGGKWSMIRMRWEQRVWRNGRSHDRNAMRRNGPMKVMENATDTHFLLRNEGSTLRKTTLLNWMKTSPKTCQMGGFLVFNEVEGRFGGNLKEEHNTTMSGNGIGRMDICFQFSGLTYGKAGEWRDGFWGKFF